SRVQRTNAAWFHIAELDSVDLGTHQALYRVASSFEHAANDVLASFVQLQTDQRHALVFVHDLDEVGLGHAIVKLNAVFERANQALVCFAEHGGQIGLGHFILRVHQTVGQFTIIG